MDVITPGKMLRLSKSSIGDAEKKAVIGVLDREFLGMGREVEEFEKALAVFFNRPVVCVANGTAALQLALQACGIGAGDEVLVQSLTYVASFQAVSATGAVPVACEVDPETLTLNCQDAEKRLTSRTKAVMPVHYSGGVGDLDEIYFFAQQHRLRVIEDAAHAFGTIYHGMRIGGFGDIACFSFDGIKNITSGEGGCIVSDDAEVLRKVKDARLLGIEKDSEKRYSGERSWEFDVIRQGWRYHMSNIMAAIGIVQLERFPELSEKRQSLAKLYDTLISHHPRIKIVKRDYNTIVPHIYPVRIKDLTDRKGLQAKLNDYGIQTGYHYQPNHWLTLYQFNHSESLPVTNDVFQELLSLPLHVDLTENNVAYIVNSLKEVVKSY